MSESSSPGHTRAGASTPGRQGNGARSDGYAATTPDELDAYAHELVANPGHGAVGVFQAPQPVGARGGPVVDPSLDIDSPFLDLFGDAPRPAQLRTAAPETSEPDFDFDFDIDERPASAAPSSAPPASAASVAPVSAAPASPAPGSGAAGPAE
jgi:hypothetical protein